MRNKDEFLKKLAENVERLANDGLTEEERRARFVPSTYYDDDYKTVDEIRAEWDAMSQDEKQKYENRRWWWSLERYGTHV